MKTPPQAVTLAALTLFASGLAALPASARAVTKHARHAAHHRVAHTQTRMATAHPKYVRGIGTHGTATTGAGQGTSTNLVPAGGTNADPLGGGTTSTGTATTGAGVSNK